MVSKPLGPRRDEPSTFRHRVQVRYGPASSDFSGPQSWRRRKQRSRPIGAAYCPARGTPAAEGTPTWQQIR